MNAIYGQTLACAGERGPCLIGLGVAVAIGAVAGFLGGLAIDHQIQETRRINDQIRRESAELDRQIIEITALQQDIETLLQRQRAVERLQNPRNRPVQLLEELARQVPEGVYLTALRQEGDRFTVSGVAQSNERVSELLRNLSGVPWMSQAELVESVAAAMTHPLKAPRRLFNFTVRAAWRAPAANKPGATASGTAGP